MPRYVLLPYEAADGWNHLSADEMQAIVGRYYEWTDRIAKAGHLRAGEKLRDKEGRVLRGSGKTMTVTDGPYSELKEVLGGFWIIEAKDYDEAVALAKDCPHLDFGTLVVRAIDEP